MTALGVLCCFALFVCLPLLASFFHLSFKNMYFQFRILLSQCGLYRNKKKSKIFLFRSERSFKKTKHTYADHSSFSPFLSIFPCITKLFYTSTPMYKTIFLKQEAEDLRLASKSLESHNMEVRSLIELDPRPTLP